MCSTHAHTHREGDGGEDGGHYLSQSLSSSSSLPNNGLGGGLVDMEATGWGGGREGGGNGRGGREGRREERVFRRWAGTSVDITYRVFTSFCLRK